MGNGKIEGAEEYKPSLNDILAMERTIMANERTFLSYIRTSLTLIVPGVTGVHLSDSQIVQIFSLLFIPVGITVFVIGIARFRKKQRAVRRTGR